jgi:hypothetical protein
MVSSFPLYLQSMKKQLTLAKPITRRYRNSRARIIETRIPFSPHTPVIINDLQISAVKVQGIEVVSGGFKW